MFNFDYITKGYIKEHNPNWLEIPDHPYSKLIVESSASGKANALLNLVNQYRILTVESSESGKANALLNLINNEPDINKNYLYATDPYKAKYQLLIDKGESTG